MNSLYYFEDDPWDKIRNLLSDQNYGKIFEISIQSSCRKGTMDGVKDKFLAELKDILGEIDSQNQLESKQVLSLLLKFKNNTIARIFLDEVQNEFSPNYEIVTERALIQWQPSNKPQAYVLKKSTLVDTIQRYPCDLGEEINYD